MDLHFNFNDAGTAASLTTDQVMASIASLPPDDASSTVQVTQYTSVSYEVPPGSDPNQLAAKLLEACRVSSPDCALHSGPSDRRALQESGGTGSAVLARSLTSGSLTAEIPDLEEAGVAVTGVAFQGVAVVLSVTAAGGADEASTLVSGSLSTDQVQAAVSTDLSLPSDALSVEVTKPIFPPMPPPSLPPMPPHPPPSPPSPTPPPPSPPTPSPPPPSPSPPPPLPPPPSPSPALPPSPSPSSPPPPHPPHSPPPPSSPPSSPPPGSGSATSEDLNDSEALVEADPTGMEGFVSWLENNILTTVLAFVGFALLVLCLCKIRRDMGLGKRSSERSERRRDFLSKGSKDSVSSFNIAVTAHEPRRPGQGPSTSTLVVPGETDAMRLQRETAAMRARIREVDELVSRIQKAQAPPQKAKPTLKAAVHAVQTAQHMEQRSLLRQQAGLVGGKLAPIPVGLPPGFADDAEAMRAHIKAIESAHAVAQRKKPTLKTTVHAVQAAQHMERVKRSRAQQGLREGYHAKMPDRMPPGFDSGTATPTRNRDRVAFRRTPSFQRTPSRDQEPSQKQKAPPGTPRGVSLLGERWPSEITPSWDQV